MAELSELILRRTQIKAACTRFSNFAKKCTNTDIQQIQSRLINFRPLFQNYDNIQSKIEIISNNDEETNNAEREMFESSYYETLAFAENMIANQLPSNVEYKSKEQTHAISVKLPILNLLTFGGQYDQWLSFKDTFKALIDNDQSLSQIQKYHSLKSCLKSETAQCIESLPITADNYAIAWSTLQNRFQNTKLIIKKHVNASFNLPATSKCSGTSIRKLLDYANIHLNALRTLKQPVESWDLLVVNMIAVKLETKLREE